MPSMRTTDDVCDMDASWTKMYCEFVNKNSTATTEDGADDYG